MSEKFLDYTYLIISLDDGTVNGTDSEEEAKQFFDSPDHAVLEVREGKAAVIDANGEPVEIERL